MSRLARFLLLLAASCSSTPEPRSGVAAIYHHARILTQSASRPEAQALAVGEDGTIVAVGEDAAVLALKGPATRTVDLEGRLILPGFIDAHAHLYGDALRDFPGALADARRAVIDKMRVYNSLGITSVHEPGNGDLSSSGITQWALYQEIRKQGALTIRINLMRYPPVRKGDRPEGDDWLRVSGVKLRVDFDLAARRALLLEPYDDDPSTCGVGFTSLDVLVEQMRAADEAGFQIAVHAIGDRANRVALDAFERLARPLRRPRIEHAQLIHPDDLNRFVRLGVIASMQPIHCIHDMRFVRQRIGERRFAGAYAWKSLLKSGCVLAFGSDAPVESPDPLWGIYAAVTRQNEQGDPAGGWMPAERLTVEEAIRAYTRDAAFAGFDEKTRGSLEAGKLADFIVLSRDITAVSPAEIPQTRVLLTVVGGREVFRR